jgi:hypothetical protein
MKKHKYYGSATFTGTDGRQHGFMSQVYQVKASIVFSMEMPPNNLPIKHQHPW